MKNAAVEPGLRSLFRLVVLFEIVYLFLEHLEMRHGRGEWFVGSSLAWVIAGLALLAVYLSVGRLEGWLGKYYLPVAVLAGVFIALPSQYLFLPAEYGLQTETSIRDTFWGLMVFLLLVVSWQYRFRYVLLFTFCTFLLEVGLIHSPNYLPRDLHQHYVHIAGARATAFLVIGYVISHLMSQQRKQRQQLEQANRRLSHYAATLEQLTVSRERNRMARELHDTVAHTLSGLAVQLEAVDSVWESDPLKARSILGRSLVATRSGLVETRHSIQALRAAPLEDLGLLLALRTLAENAAERGSLSLALNLPDKLRKLSPDVEQALYRITQEALDNIVRHAEAHQARLALTQDANRLLLEIADDGRGIDPAILKNPNGFGLQGMRERAELLGGKLDILSQTGRGATIRLELELDDDQNPDL